MAGGGGGGWRGKGGVKEDDKVPSFVRVLCVEATKNRLFGSTRFRLYIFIDNDICRSNCWLGWLKTETEALTARDGYVGCEPWRA